MSKIDLVYFVYQNYNDLYLKMMPFLKNSDRVFQHVAIPQKQRGIGLSHDMSVKEREYTWLSLLS